MTAPQPMSREELIELAALDALGLLDEYEASLYTRSFHQSPTGVQEELRNLQAEIAADDSFLPDVSPGPELRQRVLARVAEAIEDENREFAPLATIGRRQHHQSGVSGRVGLAKSGQFWRAACFALITGLVVSLYFLREVYTDSQLVTQLALNDATHDDYENALGPDLDDFLAALKTGNCSVRVFTPSSENRKGAAQIYLNPKSSQAFLVVMALPDNEDSLRLRTVDENGRIHEFAPVRCNGDMCGQRLDEVDPNLLATAKLEIVDSEDNVIFATA